jgi:hypothetical protein
MKSVKYMNRLLDIRAGIISKLRKQNMTQEKKIAELERANRVLKLAVYGDESEAA